MKNTSTVAAVVLIFLPGAPGLSAPPTKREAAAALRRSLSFFRNHVGHQGAYLWRYSADLNKQEGEGRAFKTSGWTQAPGTPSVGEAYLRAWRLTGRKDCLAAAREAADALIRTQLKSGGWDSRFELAPAHRGRYAYRVDGEQAGGRNHTTFDDDKSQSALRLLMHVDEALQFKDQRVQGAVKYALQKMLGAQYANGAWPQQYSDQPDASLRPVQRASYPDQWSRTFSGKDYRGYYTLNDNNMSNLIEMFCEAYRVYGDKQYLRSAEQTGDFFILAQMPEPQPGWAQQYDLNMHPAWARKFEPPAITGGESQAVMRSLLSLYDRTGKKRFLEPLGRALKYYERSKLDDGRLARFYELRTNKPLYFTKQYVLTYDDSDVPTHYSFKVGARLESITKAYRSANSNAPRLLRSGPLPKPRIVPSKRLSHLAAKAITALDDRGAWVEDGRLKYHGKDDDTRQVIQSATFVRNFQVLAEFLVAE